VYPTVPPPDFNLDYAMRTLDRMRDLDPARLLLPHFGPVTDPVDTIDAAAERQRILAEAARLGWASGGGERAVGERIAQTLPVDEVVVDEPGRHRWRLTLWADNNIPGLAEWARSQAETEDAPAT